jgi:hypothetical protein
MEWRADPCLANAQPRLCAGEPSQRFQHILFSFSFMQGHGAQEGIQRADAERWVYRYRKALM